MFRIWKFTVFAAALCVMSISAHAGGRVALTFDDGPHKTLTPQLLSILKQEGVRATFYVRGQSAAAYPGIIRRMHAGGHEIGNHTWSHPRLSVRNVNSQLAKTDAVVQRITGVTPRTVRPPYGALNRSVRNAVGRKFVCWDVDTLDWRYRNSRRIAGYASRVSDGSVVLMHDIHATTIRAVPQMIRSLKARGFTFVTVSKIGARECGATRVARVKKKRKTVKRHVYKRKKIVRRGAKKKRVAWSYKF